MNKLWQKNWRLVWVLARTDFKLRYYGSFLGFFWSLIKPLVMFVVLYLVFTFLVRFEIENYQFHLLLGLIVWNFFVEGTNAGMHSLLGKAGIIKKIYFPRYLVVVAATLTTFFTFLMNLAVFFVIYFLLGGEIFLSLLFLPFYVLLLYLVVLGLGLGLSVLQVHFKDVFQVWELLLQAGFFVSPIIYPLSVVPEEYLKYVWLNPITVVLEGARILVLGEINGVGPMMNLLYLSFLMVIFMIGGVVIFKSFSKNVAEKI